MDTAITSSVVHAADMKPPRILGIARSAEQDFNVEDQAIRSEWNENDEEWYFSIVDMVCGWQAL